MNSSPPVRYAPPVRSVEVTHSATAANAVVTGMVPERVVDLFQAVEVEHHNAEEGARAGAAHDLAVEVLVERTMVPEPGETVGERRLCQPGQLLAASTLLTPPVTREAHEEDRAAGKTEHDQEARGAELELLHGLRGPRGRAPAVDVAEGVGQRSIQPRGLRLEGVPLIGRRDSGAKREDSSGDIGETLVARSDARRADLVHAACRSRAAHACRPQKRPRQRGAPALCASPASESRSARGQACIERARSRFRPASSAGKREAPASSRRPPTSRIPRRASRPARRSDERTYDWGSGRE